MKKERNLSSLSKKNKGFSLTKVYIPAIIGVVVIVFMFAREFDVSTFENVRFTWRSVFFIILAFILIFGRDLGLIMRFRYMTDNSLSWRQAFDMNLLSEFTSAVTPSAVGGSGLIAVFLVKEGISGAKSTTIMITNLFLDELFFVILAPIIFVFIPQNEVFNSSSVISSTMRVAFWGIYGVLMAWTLFLFVSLFIWPQLISKLLILIFKIPFLRKWRSGIHEFANQLIATSKDISQKSVGFWIVAFLMTCFAWICRFLVVNSLFSAFTLVENHGMVFARQLLIWVVMMISPTPGGSGLSEYAFKEYYNDIALGSGPILIITLIWRIVSFYLYLFLGAIFLPRWVNKKFGNNPELKAAESKSDENAGNNETD